MKTLGSKGDSDEVRRKKKKKHLKSNDFGIKWEEQN